MTTSVKNLSRPDEEIHLIDYPDNGATITHKISQQLKNTHTSNTNILQELQHGIFLLTIKKESNKNPLVLKRMSDRTQYAILPSQYDNSQFDKISLDRVKNRCHARTLASWVISLSNKESLASCYLLFYFHLDYVQNILSRALTNAALEITEVLTNRTVIVDNGKFHYPLAISMLPALAVWHDQPLTIAVDNEIRALKTKFALLESLFKALKKTHAENGWSLANGQMRFTEEGTTKTFDYASLIDDIQYAQAEDEIEGYLSSFHINDLDCSKSFPTVLVRSPVHLKARPWALSARKYGYTIVAANENNGKQTAISARAKDFASAMGLWQKRAERHLYRHNYRARVVFSDAKESKVFSLVGEQVASIALYPALISGVFETLSLIVPKSVRLVAHSEDVLTIAHETASWVSINEASQRAFLMFRLVSPDGADALSLFETVSLPPVGAGRFQLRTVPEMFFELIDSAGAFYQHSAPSGHTHYLLGLAYECLHEWGLAVAEFQKALRFDNNDPDIYHNLGYALMEIGHIKEALPFLKRAFDLLPEDPEVANNLGRSNMECGHIHEAIYAFEHAVRLSPGSADYLKNLGDGYLLAARPQDALVMLQKAIRSDPHFALAHASLASLHLAIGDEALARKHALLAYKENPTDANIANLLWRLTLQKK